ncbi:endonuclease/exonuclease/phosphatase family protein, partial [Mariniblastus sp.]|nr:endonuclease/exonuclease/phosphatase family protein [Mariniblastus sp.]
MQEDARPAVNSWLSFHAVLTVLIGFGALVILGLFLFGFAARHFLLAELISSFNAQLAFLMLICGALLLLLRQKVFGGLLLVISIGQILFLASVFLPATQPPPGPQTIKVMSMNVLGDNYQFQQVIDQVERVSPDVLLLIEYSNQWHDKMQALHTTYPHRMLEPRWHGYGIALFSKLPLEDAEVWQLTKKDTDVPALSAQVNMGDRSLRIAGLHTMSPTSPLRMRLRTEQMHEMADLLKTADEPTVLLGDFNCTPWSPFLKELAATCGYRDSRQGQGYLASWSVELPWFFWIPID